MGPVRLRHFHIPSSPSQGLYPDYQTAAAVQELFRRRLLDLKDNNNDNNTKSNNRGHGTFSPASLAHPTLISFTPKPTYTLGRRQASFSSMTNSQSATLSPAEITRLKAPLYIPASASAQAHGHLIAEDSSDNNNHTSATTASTQNGHIFHPSLLSSPRGGLATYHGPGQVVLWPVMVIKSNSASAPLGYKSFTVRCYSRLLENTTIALLQRLFGLKGFTTDDPGVWVRTPFDNVRKISALGIHLRRHVSSLGAAINLDMPTTTTTTTMTSVAAADEQQNPWTRFVACGLEGKGVTCVEEELRTAGGSGIHGVDAETVARAWAEELAVRMELHPRDVERVARDEVAEVVETARREGFVDAMAADEI
ncbi:hypothetical protein BD289DRAFT_401069 [Coniella lustricola]|uniref:BPL/LPL catalytic domain-containing protein n=1 Tax=Coniella lustricola TaxID=2025994 RepID=A0A2T3ALD6_9PEZI|nr:hypothetical protein BD289DRAFT_401069 [Coniella lustricola]